MSGRRKHHAGAYHGVRLPRGVALEAAAVVLAGHDAEHHLAEALDRGGAGLAIGLGDALALILGELALELDAFVGELEEALAAVRLPVCWRMKPWRTSWPRTRLKLCLVMRRMPRSSVTVICG